MQDLGPHTCTVDSPLAKEPLYWTCVVDQASLSEGALLASSFIEAVASTVGCATWG